MSGSHIGHEHQSRLGHGLGVGNSFGVVYSYRCEVQLTVLGRSEINIDTISMFVCQQIDILQCSLCLVTRVMAGYVTKNS